jgi:transcription elongation factor
MTAIATTIMEMQPEMSMSTAITIITPMTKRPTAIATATMQKEDAGTTEAATAPMRKGSSAPAWERRGTRSSRQWRQEHKASRTSSAQPEQTPATDAAVL